MRTLLKRLPFSYPGGLPGVDWTHPAAQNLLISTVAKDGNHVNLLKGVSGTIAGTPTRAIDGTISESVTFPGVTDRTNFPFTTIAPPSATTAAIFRITVINASPTDFAGDSNGSNVGAGIGTDSSAGFSFRWGGQFFEIGR